MVVCYRRKASMRGSKRLLDRNQQTTMEVTHLTIHYYVVTIVRFRERVSECVGFNVPLDT